MSKDKSLLGLISIIIGILLFVFFVGKFAIQLIAAILGIILINYGLEKLGFPSLQSLIFQVSHNLIEKFRRR